MYVLYYIEKYFIKKRTHILTRLVLNVKIEKERNILIVTFLFFSSLIEL